MSEAGKTLTFVAAGALALGGAYFINSPPSSTIATGKQGVGQYINQDIDVSKPKRLRIVKFDRQTAAVREFEVAEVDGVWSIPSKDSYPADATRQMAEAATGVMDRKILRVAAESAEAHPDLGVVDPLSENLGSKSTGVGTRVIMTDAEDNEVVDMIIGKAVKDAEGQRYVRRSNQDVVYVVELDPASLSTNFDDWIEDDLLKLNPFDIRKLFVNDYSADLGLVMTPEGIRTRVTWDRRGEITLDYDNAEAKWQADSVKKYDRQKKEMVDDPVGEDEEINQDALGKLRNGLDDLLIVDVARKPEGLSADLKAGDDFLKKDNEETFEDLIKKGFSPVAVNGKEAEILSSEGEVVCTLRDGVEYVLRFGKLQVQTESAEGDESTAETAAADGQAPAGEPPAEKTDKKDAENLRRYLFVMARFNKDAVEKPKLKELPPLPAGAEKPQDEAAPAADASDAAATPESAPAAEPSETQGGDQGETADAASAGPGEDEAAPAAADAAAPAAGEPAAEPADDKPAENSTDQSADDAATAELEKLIAERKEIEQENERLEAEYKETLAAGEKKVNELNERFGDWYYVIADDVYKQIHLGRDQIITKKGKPAAAGAPGAAEGLSPAAAGLPELPVAPPAAPAETPAPAEPAAAPAEPPAAAAEPPAETPAAEAAEPAEPAETPAAESAEPAETPADSQ